MKVTSYVALVSCFVLYVVGCGGSDQPQEEQGATTSALVTGAGSPAPGVVCTQNDQFDTNCNTPPPAWAYVANQDCGGQGKSVAAFEVDGACPNGAAAHAHYICCGTQ